MNIILIIRYIARQEGKFHFEVSERGSSRIPGEIRLWEMLPQFII